MSFLIYLEISLDSTDEGEVPHYVYLVLIVFPPSPTEISVLCHHAETNNVFLPSGRARPSPSKKTNKVEIFLLETLILRIGFTLPSKLCKTMYLYWEQAVTKNYYIIEYSLYVVDVGFDNFIDSFRKVGGAHAIVAKISFQAKDLFNLERSRKIRPNSTKLFRPPPTSRCQHTSKEIKLYY